MVQPPPPPPDATTKGGTVAVIPENNAHDHDYPQQLEQPQQQQIQQISPGPDHTDTTTGDNQTGHNDSDPECNSNIDNTNNIVNDINYNNNNVVDADIAEAALEQRHALPAYLVEEDNVEVAEAKKVKPFFQRKEGQLAITVVGLLVVSVATLLGVFLSPEGTNDDNGGSNSLTSDEEIITEVPSTAPSFDQRATLEIVQDRGVVKCGVENLREGAVNLHEFNIDQCRAVAAAIFGDPTKVTLVIVDQDDKYEKLNGREVDVLFAGDAFTLEKLLREPTTGPHLAFGYPYHGSEVVYFGLESYIKCVNEQKRSEECKSLSICAVDTAPEIRPLISSLFPPAFIRFGPFPEMEASLLNDTCNVLVTDTYRMYGTVLQDYYSDGTYVISDSYISRNLLSSVVRYDDSEWFHIVLGTRLVRDRATQVGISKSNGDACPMNSTANQLSFYNAPRCVGNTMDISFERLSYLVLSFGENAKLPVIDAPNFGSLECDNCKDHLKYGRLKQIKERGVFNCAVFVDPLHNLTMTSLPTLVSEKFCRMMSVAILQGDPDAVNITYIDEMNYSAFPQEFDILAGIPFEALFDFDSINVNSPAAMYASFPYYFHDQYRYNGRLYNGTGVGLNLVCDSTVANSTLIGFANAIISAAVYAQRQGITRATHSKMPLIYLFGDSLTFMLRDVINYAGNYDEIINEALDISDGATGRGWNTVISNNGVSAPGVFFCDFHGSASCPPCEWVPEGYCISYTNTFGT